MSPHKKNHQVCFTASELGTFVYCPVAWHLQKCGFKPKSSKTISGSKKHIILGSKLNRMQTQNTIANYILIIGTICLILSVYLLLVL